MTASTSKLWLWLSALAVAVILGAFLRLVWVGDMEYKQDEKEIFKFSQQAGKGNPFPWLGMTSSVGIKTPGMNVWVFMMLGKIFRVGEPTQLARAVQTLNIIAIVVLVGFALSAVSVREREPWLWAAALASVNPLAVLFHRKIWQPSVFPVFSMLMLLGWWHRNRRWGAFLWGSIGVCLGQIQMAGFFMALGFAAWTLLYDRKTTLWRSWLCGTFLGALPLLPWLQYLSSELRDTSLPIRWTRLLEFKFWAYWVTEPFGWGLKYALGQSFDNFLSYPIVHGTALYFVVILHGAIVAMGLFVLARAAYFSRQEREYADVFPLGVSSQTTLALGSAFFGYGLLFSLSGLPFHRHYLVVAFPLMYVWVSSLALFPSRSRKQNSIVGRAVLLGFCITQFLLSALFLYYIHVNEGVTDGDYGITYQAQKKIISSLP